MRPTLLLLPLFLIGSLLPSLGVPVSIAAAGIHFSRGDDCQAVILQELEAETQASVADRSIELLMYSLTDGRISDELISAARAGVRVTIVMDASQASGKASKYPELKAALGDSVILCHGLAYPDGNGFGIMHEKMAILGGNIVLFGSYNWTAAAHHYNWENLILASSTDLTVACQAEFDKVLAYAKANPTGPIRGEAGF
jgi:cardiolipin hydrolase